MMSATKPTPPNQMLYPASGLLQSSYPRVAPPGGGGLPPPDSPLYSPAAAAAAAAAAYASHNYSPFAHSESSAFYSPLSGEGVDAWRTLSAQTVAAAAWAYDPNIVAAYPYGAGYGGLDVRRKNATRESTSTLKAWLFEHIKNPYPTKGEKIMLAIITKMTLTQVSTWFANARRRLKKENKMQWSPRNRTGEDDDDDDKNSDNDDDDDILGGDSPGRRSSGLGHLDDDDDDEDIIVDSGNDDSQPHPVPDFLFAERLSGRIQDFFPHRPPSQVTDLSRDRDVMISRDGDILRSRDDDVRRARDDDILRSRDSRDSFCRISLASASSSIDRLNSPPCPPPQSSSSSGQTTSSSSNATSSSSPKPAKPKIWSLADVATSVTSSSSSLPAPPPLRSSNSSSSPPLPPGFADFRSSLAAAGLRVPLGLPGSVPHSFQPWSNGLYSAAMQSLHGARIAAAAAAAGLPPGYVGGYIPMHQTSPGAMQAAAAHHAMISGALQHRHQLGLGGPAHGMGLSGPPRLPLPLSSQHDSQSTMTSGLGPAGSKSSAAAWAPGKPRSCPSPSGGADISSSSPDERDTPPVRLAGPRTPRLSNGFHSPPHSAQEIDIRDGRRFLDSTSSKASTPGNHSSTSSTSEVSPAAYRLLSKRL